MNETFSRVNNCGVAIHRRTLSLSVIYGHIFHSSTLISFLATSDECGAEKLTFMQSTTLETPIQTPEAY
ncbi:hypothetical protein TSUD_264680 [Trifolium subterraneum]|uniref:Uncharacterized protein n=1 Tax=Trifolium subterraneum TaxID=3900 RepID=A0A2Z6MWD0_TRISU|nr:hypothetical protein TSUD_264680 [Trifolium subterraneum]